MAGQIKLNTDKVAQTAVAIKNLNSGIKTAFTDVENAMNALNPHWDGVASENARNAFFGIKNAYVNDRYNVVDNYVNFLNQQIDAGYVQTENANKNLADAFK